MTKEEFAIVKTGDEIMYDELAYKVIAKGFEEVIIKGTIVHYDELSLVPNQSDPNIFEKGE